MAPTKVLVIGAAGNLGRRLVARGLARGHEVTAFVRNAAAFAAEAGTGARVIEGDARDARALSAAVRGCDTVVNAAGNAADGDSFADLFRAILGAVEREPPASGRFWALAGVAALDIPGRGAAVDLPFVPKMYRAHGQNRRALEASALDWSLMCPGPMIAAASQQIRTDLRVSLDVVPFEVPRWAAWAPGVALSLMMKSKIPELVVTYEDVADIVMSNLAPAGRFSRHRVGVALPAGERGRKDDWTLGKRGADG